MNGIPPYEERLSSRGTEALFVVLTILFLGLFGWRTAARGFDGIAAVLLAFAGFFLFYSLNYRTLRIQITPQTIRLSFGLFTWRIPIRDVESIRPDDVSIWRIGGAGIHFTWIRRRYRAMFNFLEHARVVLGLKRKRGPVRDIVFSTRHPDEIIRLVERSITGS
jgi:hypothetical protein